MSSGIEGLPIIQYKTKNFDNKVIYKLLNCFMRAGFPKIPYQLKTFLRRIHGIIIIHTSLGSRSEFIRMIIIDFNIDYFPIHKMMNNLFFIIHFVLYLRLSYATLKCVFQDKRNLTSMYILGYSD
jgi:hypothetical protein